MTFKDKVLLILAVTASAIASVTGMFFLITLAVYLWELV